MNKNILVSEVPGGGGVHGGHIQPTDYISHDQTIEGVNTFLGDICDMISIFYVGPMVCCLSSMHYHDHGVTYM